MVRSFLYVFIFVFYKLGSGFVLEHLGYIRFLISVCTYFFLEALLVLVLRTLDSGS